MRLSSSSRFSCSCSSFSPAALCSSAQEGRHGSAAGRADVRTAKDALEAGNNGNRIRYDQRLIARFPFGPYTEQAQINLAYAQYKDDKPDDAYSTVNRFIKTYPTHKHIDYAYYLRGLINFDRGGLPRTLRRART